MVCEWCAKGQVCGQVCCRCLGVLPMFGCISYRKVVLKGGVVQGSMTPTIFHQPKRFIKRLEQLRLRFLLGGVLIIGIVVCIRFL